MPERISSIIMRRRRDEVRQDNGRSRKSGEWNCGGIGEGGTVDTGVVDTLDPGKAQGLIQASRVGVGG